MNQRPTFKHVKVRKATVVPWCLGTLPPAPSHALTVKVYFRMADLANYVCDVFEFHSQGLTSSSTSNKTHFIVPFCADISVSLISVLLINVVNEK